MFRTPLKIPEVYTVNYIYIIPEIPGVHQSMIVLGYSPTRLPDQTKSEANRQSRRLIILFQKLGDNTTYLPLKPRHPNQFKTNKLLLAESW